MRALVTLLLFAVLSTGCTSTLESDPAPSESDPTRTESDPAPPSGSEPAPSESAPAASPSAPADDPTSRPGDFDQARAMAVVRHLAGNIGPRHATSPEFRTAAGWVRQRFIELGFVVELERFEVPGGESWGVPVPPGTSLNVIARPVGFDPRAPHLIVGAHLDTVPAAPGAEDNASGVGVLLAAAEASARARTRLPVVWVAFGAEEPRGPGDDDHHYGSRAYVAAMTPAARRSMRGMVSLDRVGVGAVVPVGSAGEGDPLQRQLLAAARRAEIPTVAESLSRSSDHWSFVRAGLSAARLGSTPYAAYHSSSDVPGVVEPAQLGRTGGLLLGWLAPSG